MNEVTILTKRLDRRLILLKEFMQKAKPLENGVLPFILVRNNYIWPLSMLANPSKLELGKSIFRKSKTKEES